MNLIAEVNPKQEELEREENGFSAVNGPLGVHEVSLVDILIQFALRKRLILTVTLSSVVVGVILSFALPVRYSATSKIMPPQQSQSTTALMMTQLATGGPGSLAALAGTGLGLKNPNEIYIGLLTSRPISDAIIRRFNLVSEYHSRDMTAARKKLAGFTSVTSEKSGLVAIEVTDRDKNRVADIANAYVDQLRMLTDHLSMTEAAQRRLFYEQQLVKANKSLVAAEVAFQQVQQTRGMVSLDAQARAMIGSLAALRGQIAAKQVELQALRSYSTEQNPEVELAKRELATLQSEEARLEEPNHATRAGGLGLGDIPGAGREYLSAAHEVAYRQTLYDLLIKQYEAAKLDESKEATVIQVVEPAIEPDRHSSPHRILILLGALIVGLFLGCAAALIQWAAECAQADPKIMQQLRSLKYALRK